MKKGLLTAVLCALVLSACTTPGKRTAIGAGAGAATGAIAGAVIAHNTGGKAESGAIYGALAGAALGGGIGNYLDKQAKELAAIADVTRAEDGSIIVTLKNEETACLGSAILAGTAAGLFDSVESACADKISLNKVYLPQDTDYSECYRRFRELENQFS